MTGHNSRRNRYNDDSSDIDVRNDRTSRNRGKHKHKKNIYRSPQSSIYSSASSLVDDEVESKKLADEPKTKKKCCSSPCHKKTILIGALIFLQIAAFIGIGVFFGEQQREIDKHEHLVGFYQSVSYYMLNSSSSQTLEILQKIFLLMTNIHSAQNSFAFIFFP